MSSGKLVHTIGELRRAVEAFSDDCPLLMPVEVIYTFGAMRGGSIELFVDMPNEMPRLPPAPTTNPAAEKVTGRDGVD